jgi:hypothetical protein
MVWKLRIAIVIAFVLGGGLAIPNQALAADRVPFKGSDVGHFVVPDSCAGGALHVVINGSGRATHLGRYSYAANECFDPATGAFAGSPTFTATNGDTMFGHYSGQVFPTDDPNVITYEEELAITGGSGRFAGEDEEFHVSGIANLATGEYSQTLSGTVSRPGSVQG